MNSQDKTVVLTFVGCYLPGFRGGGPIRTIDNLVARLGDEFDFRIVTTDRDLGDLHPYPSIKVDAWNQVGKAQVFYASPSSRSLPSLVRLIRGTRHDVLYLNSFFNTTFTLKPLLARWLKLVPGRPTIVAPRGEFSVEALKLKRWKKIPFTRLVFWMGLFDNVIWQASTIFERADIKRLIGTHRSKIYVAMNIAVASDLTPSVMPLNKEYEDSKQKNTLDLRVCFLSRIAPMKNLDYAIKVLAKVKAPVQFHIYGPKESPSYWIECDALIAQLPSNIRVSYGGSVENSQVRSVIATHDLFFVPSRGENFGHVFMEAFSAGVPILVSDQTPWRRLQDQKLGWDISLEKPEEFVRAVEEAAAFDQSKRVDMRARCIAFARDKADDIEALNMNRNLFLANVSL